MWLNMRNLLGVFRGMAKGTEWEGLRWTREHTNLRGLLDQVPAAQAEEEIWGQLPASWPA